MTALVFARDMRDAERAAQLLGIRRWVMPGGAVFGETLTPVVYVQGWRRAGIYGPAVAAAACARLAPNAQEIEQELAPLFVARPVMASMAQAELDAQRKRRHLADVFAPMLDFQAVEVERPARTRLGRLWRTIHHAARRQRPVTYRRAS